MSEFKEIISIGFDRGSADFRVGAVIGDLDYEQMTELRAMIPVAIGQAEDMWKRMRKDSPATGASKKATPLTVISE